jgi:hypothetical protein
VNLVIHAFIIQVLACPWCFAAPRRAAISYPRPRQKLSRMSTELRAQFSYLPHPHDSRHILNPSPPCSFFVQCAPVIREFGIRGAFTESYPSVLLTLSGPNVT